MPKAHLQNTASEVARREQPVSARAANPNVRKAAPAVRRILDDAQRKPKLYVDRVIIHGEGE